MSLKPLTVPTAAIHDTWIPWFHPVSDPTFSLNAQLIDDTLFFYLIQTLVILPAMLRLFRI